MNKVYLTIDPGKHKTGLAVLDDKKNIIFREVALTSKLEEILNILFSQYKIDAIILGNTGERTLVKEIIQRNKKDLQIFEANEYNSTQEARKLYWKMNKRKWFLRFIPSSLLTPKEPYDDLAAYVIGINYLDKLSK